MAAEITVACFLWLDPSRIWRGYSYGDRHVHVLKRMVERHLSLPHRFVCIADAPVEGVETIRLDPATHIEGTCYAKLMIWKPDIGKLLGERILCLDLDCVVTGSLDEIAGRTKDVVLWRNPNYRADAEPPRRAFYQSSMILLTAGARPEVWEHFDPLASPAAIAPHWRATEQAWLSHILRHDEAYWDSSWGVYGAGRLNSEGVGSELPDDARIVFFPGRREPSQVETQRKHPWIRGFYQ